MNKPPITLELVQVASPCPAAWDEMTGDQRVRFCRQCSLHVYNLSDMTRGEAEAFLNKAEGRTCIRLFRREDGMILTRDCPVGLRALRQRLVRGVAALAGVLVALVSGTLFAGRAKLPGVGRPQVSYAEWIEPGSTHKGSFAMGAVICRPPPSPNIPVPVVENYTVEPQESPLPTPTAGQLEEIRERLQR